jgi:hypothetical protein
MELQEQTVLSLNEKVLYFLVTLTVFTSGLSAIENASKFGLSDSAWRSGWLQNFSTEMMGAIATFVLFELVVAARQRLRDKEENTAQLDAMREAVTEESRIQLDALRVAVTQAVSDEMRRIQQGNATARLQAAQKAPLEVRQPIIDEMRVLDFLQGANLWGANLTQANMVQANLEGATLRSANLTQARLGFSVLIDADLRRANLTKIDLAGASLQGTNLRYVSLQGANLRSAKFNQSTVLPDGTHWNPDADLARFTDPNHTDFWRAESPYSPAHGGNDESDDES